MVPYEVAMAIRPHGSISHSHQFPCQQFSTPRYATPTAICATLELYLDSNLKKYG
jgi:hypothetical protein